MNALHASLLALSTLAASAAAARDPPEWGAEQYARWDFESALRMWHDGLYGGLLYYHDGRGPLASRLYEAMDADGDAARPVDWTVTTVVCATDNDCAATALIRFTDEAVGGLRRYRLVRESGQFWGLHSEEILVCPEGYRLQYQGVCFNIADELGNDPDIETRTAEPVAAD
jgi:hypothetical protein